MSSSGTSDREGWSSLSAEERLEELGLSVLRCLGRFPGLEARALSADGSGGVNGVKERGRADLRLAMEDLSLFFFVAAAVVEVLTGVEGRSLAMVVEVGAGRRVVREEEEAGGLEEEEEDAGTMRGRGEGWAGRDREGRSEGSSSSSSRRVKNGGTYKVWGCCDEPWNDERGEGRWW